MNTLKQLSMLIFLLAATLSRGQAEGLDASQLETAKALYVKMLESPDFKEMQQVNTELYALLKEVKFDQFAEKGVDADENTVYEWVRKNAPKEKADRIILLLDEVKKRDKKRYKSNPEFYELVRIATPEQRTAIFSGGQQK